MEYIKATILFESILQLAHHYDLMKGPESKLNWENLIKHELNKYLKPEYMMSWRIAVANQCESTVNN